MQSTYARQYEAFRAALKQARINQGLTQKAVANHLNTPQSFVSKYENGERRLDVVEFLLVASVLETDPIEILKSAGLFKD